MLPYWLSNILCQTKLFDVAMQFFKLNRESLQQVVEKMTDNKKLQAVFTYCFGDYGTYSNNLEYYLGGANLV